MTFYLLQSAAMVLVAYFVGCLFGAAFKSLTTTAPQDSDYPELATATAAGAAAPLAREMPRPASSPPIAPVSDSAPPAAARVGSAAAPVTQTPAGPVSVGPASVRPVSLSPATVSPGPTADVAANAPKAPAVSQRPTVSDAASATAAAAAAAAMATAAALRPAAAPPRDQAVMAGAAPATSDGDDLKRIKGIGPEIEGKLNAMGVRRYAAIAAWSSADVARVNREIGHDGRVQHENWIEQAQILARGEATAFSRRVDRREVNTGMVDNWTPTAPNEVARQAGSGPLPQQTARVQTAALTGAAGAPQAASTAGQAAPIQATAGQAAPIQATAGQATAGQATPAQALQNTPQQPAAAQMPAAPAPGVTAPVVTAPRVTITPPVTPAASPAPVQAPMQAGVGMATATAAAAAAAAASAAGVGVRPAVPAPVLQPTPLSASDPASRTVPAVSPAGSATAQYVPAQQVTLQQAPLQQAPLQPIPGQVAVKGTGSPAQPISMRPAPGPGNARRFVRLAAAEGKPDQLALIAHIGEKTADDLNRYGVYHFWQLAAMGPDDIDYMEARLGHKGRMRREEWPEQARDLMAGKPPRPRTEPGHEHPHTHTSHAHVTPGQPHSHRPLHPHSPAVAQQPGQQAGAQAPLETRQSPPVAAAAAQTSGTGGAGSTGSTPAVPPTVTHSARHGHGTAHPVPPASPIQAPVPISGPVSAAGATSVGSAQEVVPPAIVRTAAPASPAIAQTRPPVAPAPGPGPASQPVSPSAAGAAPSVSLPAAVTATGTAAAAAVVAPAISLGAATPEPAEVAPSTWTPRSRPGNVAARTRDDLKRIKGIGVVIEKKLEAMGITSYAQIAVWSTADIDKVSNALDFKGRIEREQWVDQARILDGGGQTDFSRRMDRGDVGGVSS